MEPSEREFMQLLDGDDEIWYRRNMAKKEAARPSARGKEKAAASTKSYASASKTGRPSKGDLEIVGTKLPIGYLRLLDEEAGRLGMGKREFLLLLHQRRTNEVVFQRPQTGPRPILAEEELRQVKPYKWPLTAEQRKKIDTERLRVGIPSVAMYIIVLLCDWLGLQVFSPSQAAVVGVGDDTVA